MITRPTSFARERWVQRASLLVALLAACGGEVDRDEPDAAIGEDGGQRHLDAAQDGTRDATVVDVTRPSPPPLPRDELCNDDSECPAGQWCYGDVTANGSFSEAYCRAGCIGPTDHAVYCRNDAQCCNGLRCCRGCGEREGMCIAAREPTDAGTP